MKHVDMRKLPAAAQEERRRQVIGLRQAGMVPDAIAAQVGLTRTGVFNICKRFAERGAAGLRSGPRGPKPGTGRFLDTAQEAEVRDLIRRHTPDELDLPFALWSRTAVQELVLRRCGVRLAVRSTGTYLARWGFTAQKPLRRAYEQALRCPSTRCRARNLRQLRPAAVRRWLRRDYPAIVARAKRARGVIFWGDETGLRSDAVRGRGYAPRGRTPVVRVCHRRAGLSLLSAVTNKGELRWMVVDGAVKAPALVRFLGRLVRDTGRKVFLILDRLKAHRARLTQDWLAEHRAEIEVHYLPADTLRLPSIDAAHRRNLGRLRPELTPTEGVNAELKQAVPRKAPARSKQQLMRAAISHMHSLSKQPRRIRSIFRHRQFRYAA
jgi:transposase